MKHIKKILTAWMLGVILVGTQISYSWNLGVNKVEVIDATTLSVELSDNPNMKEGIQKDAEVAVLQDIQIKGAFLSQWSTKEVEIVTDTPLLPNTRYSLLTLSWTEGSIDFETPAEVDGYIAKNTLSIKTTDIEQIEIIDAQNMIVTYRQDLTALSYDYTLLAESNILSVSKDNFDSPELTISLEPPLSSNTNYILMFVELRDAAWDIIDFDTGIFDFSTKEVIPPQEGSLSWGMSSESPRENVLWVIDDTENIQDLQAAPENTSLEKDSETSLVSIAMNNNETPATGATTWVLVMLTLFINTLFFFARKKSQIHG